jgi:class 3 adenylate cyclase
MRETREQRRLAAILAADVVGYNQTAKNSDRFSAKGN